MSEYCKINSIYKRHISGPNNGKFIVGEYSLPEFEYLKDNAWEFTEKVDGTNIRIMWDGQKLSFGGRTDSAQIYVTLLNRLQEIAIPEKFREIFADKPAVVYGEGHGAKIQAGGGNYKSDGVDFVAFDVRIGSWWLKQEDARSIAANLGFRYVPVVLTGTLADAEARVKIGIGSAWGPFFAEGVVGRPKVDLLSRNGGRVIIKMKTRDYK